MSENQRKPYGGSETALVIGIDVGTTFSGVSYAILTPGQVPEVHSVTGFKGQENLHGSTKVPSVVYYDASGQPIARGCEFNEDSEEFESVLKVEWFKLLLRPTSSRVSADEVPPVKLPEGTTVVDVWGEFLKYMKVCVRDYISEREVDGKRLWARAGESAIYVLTHPNGWRGRQQDQIRQAAIQGGLVPDTPEGKSRIEFLSEGEASFHWCVDDGLVKKALSVGSHVIICDAGGGTIDVSSFRIKTLQPLELEEAAESESKIAGSVFVTSNFHFWTKDKLEGSKYGTAEYLATLTTKFNSTTKCIFKDSGKIVRIKFGSRSDTDDTIGVRNGFLSLDGSIVASFFENSCREAADAIEKHLISGEQSYVFLVGGFASSPWLYSEIKRRLAHLTSKVYRDDSQTAKAVAHGAVAYFLDRLVHSRIAKYTYGAPGYPVYDETSKLHRARQKNTFMLKGVKCLKDGFQCLLQRGESIPRDAIYRTQRFTTLRKAPTGPKPISLTLERYSGSIKDIAFHDMDEKDTFKPVCTFSGVIPEQAFRRYKRPDGFLWVFEYEFVLMLGSTELKCYVEWKQDGEVRRSDAASMWTDF